MLLIPVLGLLAQGKRAQLLCVAACVCMPLFIIAGVPAMFTVVVCTALVLTLKESEISVAEEVAV
jgi:hypothetical protein